MVTSDAGHAREDTQDLKQHVAEPETHQQPQAATSPLASSSKATADSIRIKNRRKRYLDLNSSYYSSDLELADPLLYDRLVRRFQTSAEREQEGRRKGYSGRLEADLHRSEAKLAALRDPRGQASELTYRRGPTGEILAEDKDEAPASKEEAWDRWVYEMGRRFMRGDDDDFDYSTVDANEAYDDVAEEDRVQLEQYLADESPSWHKTPEGETGVQDF